MTTDNSHINTLRLTLPSPYNVHPFGFRAWCAGASFTLLDASVLMGLKPTGTHFLSDLAVHLRFKEWWAVSPLAQGRTRGCTLSYRKCFVNMWYFYSKEISLNEKFYSYSPSNGGGLRTLLWEDWSKQSRQIFAPHQSLSPHHDSEWKNHPLSSPGIR